MPIIVIGPPGLKYQWIKEWCNAGIPNMQFWSFDEFVINATLGSQPTTPESCDAYLQRRAEEAKPDQSAKDPEQTSKKMEEELKKIQEPRQGKYQTCIFHL